MASDNATAIRRHRARRLYAAGYSQRQAGTLLNVQRRVVSTWVRDLVPRTAEQWRARPVRTLPTVIFDDQDTVPVIITGLPAPPEDREDPRPGRLLARMAAGQSLRDAARAERLSVAAAQRVVVTDG